MINRTVLSSMILSLVACAQGPSLGRASDVVITARHEAMGSDAAACAQFRPTARDVTNFLNSAVIITPPEQHHQFYVSDCRVEGTAKLRGVDANWEMNLMGTGKVTLGSEFSYLIADEDHRDADQE